MCPLSALRFVARNGISELYLHGVEVLVFAQLLHAVGFSGHVGIVFHYALKQFLVLFVRQCRCFRGERVEHDHRVQLRIVVIGKLQSNVGEAETIQFAK